MGEFSVSVGDVVGSEFSVEVFSNDQNSILVKLLKFDTLQHITAFQK